MLQKFFSLLRFSIDEDAPMPSDIKFEDWLGLYEMACQQSLIGVLYKGVSKMPAELQPEKDIMIHWYAFAEHIAGFNKMYNRCIEDLFVRFDADGFKCCILKGQGNTLYYPDAFVRAPGDFDAWLNGDENKIIKYVFSVNRIITFMRL